MDPHNDRNRIVTRILLPSGKTIELLGSSTDAARAEVDFPVTGDSSDEGAARRASEPLPRHVRTSTPSQPHVCLDCGSALVYPVAWDAAGDGRWAVELRCPHCERTDRAVLELDVAERFDEELERGAETLVDDLARLSEANMLEDVERFTSALRADAIVPADF